MERKCISRALAVCLSNLINVSNARVFSHVLQIFTPDYGAVVCLIKQRRRRRRRHTFNRQRNVTNGVMP